jgi:hypothetical protein
MTQKEAAKQLHLSVRQCFAKHQFVKMGDILKWWHDIPYETKVKEAGNLDLSQFSTDFLWLISTFGPEKKVDHQAIDAKI